MNLGFHNNVNNMNHQISIITPSLNQGQYIEKTIKSVLLQDVNGLEYLVIDGGSTDETISVLKRYEDQLFWVSEKDDGHSDAINKGILRSSAPIIGWLNSDDIYYPGALNSILDYFDAHPDVEVIYGDANHINEDDEIIEKYPTEEWNWERLLETCYISQPATFLRRDVIDQHGLLDVGLRYSMDYEYWLRLGKAGVKFAHISQVLAATRLHDTAFTISSRIACHGAVNDIMNAHFGRTPDTWIFNYAHAVADQKGFRRANRLRFALVVSLASYYAAMRWNHTISRNVFDTTFRWVRGNARITLKEIFSR